MSIELVMTSNHFILCHHLLLLPPIFPQIRVFSSESVLHSRWPKYWSFSFNISPSNEYSGLISLRMDWVDPRGSQESSPAPQFKRINSLALSFLHSLLAIHKSSFKKYPFISLLYISQLYCFSLSLFPLFINDCKIQYDLILLTYIPDNGDDR